jgi:hypothetical protein
MKSLVSMGSLKLCAGQPQAVGEKWWGAVEYERGHRGKFVGVIGSASLGAATACQLCFAQ